MANTTKPAVATSCVPASRDGWRSSQPTGRESAPIRFDRSGAKWSVTAATFVDMAAEAALGIDPNATEPLYLDNTGHPAANRFALAHALKSRVNALGLSWNDTSGKNNGQYAPFSWRSA